MQNFITFLINEVNGTNTLHKAIASVTKTLDNPLRKQLNKVKKSINKSVLGNKFIQFKKDAREKIISTNAKRIKKIRNTIKNNSSN